MRHHNGRLLAAISGILALAASVPAAYAAPATATEAAEDTGGIETVVVTARKRAESSQEVPVSVIAISEAQIRAQDLTSLEKLAASTPNFTVGRASNGSGAQLTLRGIGSSSTSIGIEQSVAVIVDGAYYGQGRIIQEGFFDLAGIEVLKGPQALFFGKNATAGVISLRTADPGSEPEFAVRASYEFATSDAAQIEAIASGPVSDTLGIRFAVRGSKMDKGYYENIASPTAYNTFDIATGNLNAHTALPASKDAPGEEELLARLTFKWTPNDQLTGTLKVAIDRNKVNNSSWNYVAFRCNGGVSTLNGQPCTEDFITRQLNMPADMAADFPYAREDGAQYNDYKSHAVTTNIEYETDALNWTWVNNFNRNNNRWACHCDFQASPAATFATEDSTWKALSTELRALTKSDGPLNGMFGVYWQDTRRDFRQHIAFANIEDSSQSAANRYQATSKISYTDGRTISLFGQAIWEITPALEATAGVRYTDEKKNSAFEQPYNNGAVTAIFRPADDPDGLGRLAARQKFKNWSPEVTLSWKPADGIMIYGAYKTGYKSGGFSGSGINSKFSADPLSDLVFNPEKAKGFEVGVKSTILDNQLRLNATVFQYKYTDLQVDFFNSSIFAFNTITADAKTRGVELEVEYAPRALEGLSLHGALNYNKATYTRFIGPCFGGQTPAQGCTLTNPNGTPFPFQDYSGGTLGMAPKLTGNVGGRYEVAVGANLVLAFSADVRYNDDYLASSFGNQASAIDSYTSVDAAIRLGREDGRWEVALVGKNLTDEFFVTGVVDGPSTGSGTGTAGGVIADQLGFGTLPRTVTLQVSTRF